MNGKQKAAALLRKPTPRNRPGKHRLRRSSRWNRRDGSLPEP